jgi:hypothetical protein
MASVGTPTKVAGMKSNAPKQIRLTRRSPAYWRVTIDNPPINFMGPEMVRQFQELIVAIEFDGQVRVVVFDSAMDDYFLNHSDFTAKLEDLTSMPTGPTGLPPALAYPNEQSLRNLIAEPGIINCGSSRREKAAALNTSSFTETTAAETEQEQRVTDHRRCSHCTLACSGVQFAFASAVLVLYSNNLVASTIRTILGI